MINVLLAFVMSVGFMTFIPVPMVEWTEKRIRIMPYTFPFVGAVIGGLGSLAFYLLYRSDLSLFLKAAIMLIYYLAVTGGLHMDGLMDTADAYFSRRDKEKKLEIMKDSRVGAFAVMSVVALLLLKLAFIYELAGKGSNLYLAVLFVPVLSRTLQPAVMCTFPYAKKDGLAKMYGDTLNKGKAVYFYGLFVLISTVMVIFIDFRLVWMAGAVAAYYIFYYFSTKKQFGGITGDVLGAFVELSELLMFGVLAFIF